MLSEKKLKDASDRNGTGKTAFMSSGACLRHRRQHIHLRENKEFIMVKLLFLAFLKFQGFNKLQLPVHASVY